MRNTLLYLRRAAGVILLVSLALLFVLLARLALPGQSPPVAYPGPGETSTPTATRTPTPTATLPPYPPPGGGSSVLPTATPEPTFTPTPTPWPVSALPRLEVQATPGAFRGMCILYVDHAKLGFFVTDLSNQNIFQWPVWPEDQRDGNPSSMLRVSPDGSQILYSLWFEGPGTSLDDLKRNSIWTMNPDGSNKRQLLEASEDWYPVDAIWSPDGRRIAFRAASLDLVRLMPVSRELWVMNADGSEPRQVLSDPTLLKLGMEAPALFFRWMGNGYIYMASDSLYAVNPQDGSLYRLMDGVDALYLGFTLSLDGQHAWGFPEVPVESLRAAGFQTIDLPENYGVVWSPDGSRLAYVAAGMEGTWVRDLTSGKERQLLRYKTGEDVRLKAFSPDNRYLAYQTDDGIYVFDLESEPIEPRLVLADPHDPLSGYRALEFLAWIPLQ
jgi:dipeptidyl aminopeptidase/acylaminoacyl peptidase